MFSKLNHRQFIKHGKIKVNDKIEINGEEFRLTNECWNEFSHPCI